MAVVGVVPAAGRAERLQPLEISKEVVDVGGRPVIDYLVERMRAAPCDELRVVTRPEKRDVGEHARVLGATLVEGEPRTVSESIGLGLAGLDPEDIALIGFPDSVWEPPDGFASLLAEVDIGSDVVLGIFRSSEPERSDVVELTANGTVANVLVKPGRPPSDRIWGCAAARVRALEKLAAHDEPGLLFAWLARAGRVRGVAFPGEFIDIGTRASLARAQALFPGSP
jgi:NDP-sugar pyrophosphorylase family protein